MHQRIVNVAQIVLAQAESQALASLKAGYCHRELPSTCGRIEPR